MSMVTGRQFREKTNIDADYMLYEILCTLGIQEDTEDLGSSNSSITMIIDSDKKIIGKITQSPGRMLIQKIIE